ncbi:DUF732 domain-containing protein [Actinomycetospora soli]|uniref:DUF732 domain-containing protein n=1 Tax=Actinomycetospora soli TaxID=2893887 RepID=UPI001E3BEEC7|nr:DUF732 domain-containing protein [Actinomycetospora soli]MCD2191254.1 DUF732 domain-containing protein [Actinomycetospora soli]
MSIEEPRTAAPLSRPGAAPGRAPSSAPRPPGRPDLFGAPATGPSGPGGWSPTPNPLPTRTADYLGPTGTWPAPAPTGQWAPPTPRSGAGLAVTGLILGAIGVGLGWVPVVSFLAVLIALGALVCAVIAFARSAAPRPRVSQVGLAVAVAALIVSLVGSIFSVELIADRLEARRQVTAPISAPVSPNVPARPGAAPPGAVPPGVTNYGPGPERIFLTAVRRVGVVVTDERAAVDLGYGVCGLIVDGVPRQQIYQEVAEASGLPSSEAAGVAGAAIGSFCPGR